MSKNSSIKFKYFIFLVSFFVFNLLSSNAQITASSSRVNTSSTDYMAVANNSISGAGKLIQNVNTNIGGNLVILLSSVAFILFLWGLVRFIYDRSNGDDKRLEKDKEAMGWGLAALFVVISVWGIIKMFQGFLGIENSGNIVLPKICVNGSCDVSTGGVTPGGVIKPAGDFGTTTPKKLDVKNVDGTYTIDSIRSWPNILKHGMGSPDGTNEVAQLQQFLKDQNYGSYLGSTGVNHDGVDGIFGPGTASAVKALQKDVALAQDGMVGAGTRAVILYRFMKAQPTADTYDVNSWPNIITTGSTDANTGGAVMSLQAFLSDEGYNLGTSGVYGDGTDGIYGGLTAKALLSFQAKYYLKEDPSLKLFPPFPNNQYFLLMCVE